MTKQPRLSFALRATLIFALIASLWIILKEYLLGMASTVAPSHTFHAILYDLIFVLITALLTYLSLTYYERKQAQLLDALRASEKKYYGFITQLNDGAALVDEAGRIIEWNPTWERWSGWMYADVVGRPFWDVQLQILPPEQRTPERAAQFKKLTLGALLSQEAPGFKWPLEITVTRPDGGQTLIEQTIFPIKTGLGLRLGSISRDITQRKQAETALRRANRALQTISACNQAVAQATDEPALLAAVCQAIVEQGGYRLAWVGCAEHDADKTVRPVAQAGFEAGYLQTLPISWADTDLGRGPTGTAIRTGAPSLARHISTNPAHKSWRTAAMQRGYQSSIALPLSMQGQTWGALNIYAAEPDAFDAEEVCLLTDLAHDLAFGIAALRARAEQAKATHALRASESRYRMISENTGDVIWTLDIATERFTYISPSVYRLRGFTPEEVLAQTVEEALTPESFAAMQLLFQQWLMACASGVPPTQAYVAELDHPHKNGAIVHTEAVVTLLCNAAGQPVEILGVTRDMTAHCRAEAEIRRHVDELAALYATSLALTMPHKLPDLLHAIVERATRLLNAASGGLYLCEPERQQVRCVVSYNTSRDFTGVVLNYGEGVAGVVAQTGQPLIIDDYRDWPGRAAVFEEEQPFSAVLSVPLSWQGQVTGVLHALNDVQTRRFTQADQELLTLFAQQAAIAVANARQLENEHTARVEAELRQRHLTLLAELARAVLTMPDLRATLQLLADQAGALLGADGCFVSLWDEAQQQTRPTAAYGAARATYPQLQVEPGEPTLTAAVLRAGHALAIEDARHSPYISPRIAAQFPSRSLLGLPLIANNHKLGALLIAFDEPHSFTADEIARGEQAANLFALAIDKAHLYETTRRRAEELALLNCVGLALTSGRELPAVLRALDTQCQQVLPMDSFYVALYDAESDVIRFPLFRDAEHDLMMPPRDLRAQPGLTGEIIQNRQTLYIADALAPDGLKDLAFFRSGGTPARAYVGVPLIVRDTVIGVMSVQSYQPNAYTPEQIRLLETIAAQAAITVENARLYDATRHYATELEQRVAARTEDLAQREAALQAANAELQKLDQLKNTFIANISHELRTPLTVLKSYHYLMEHGNPEKRDAYMETLNRETDLLWRLIENLLDISRLELGLPLPDLAPVDLNRLVTQLTVARQPLFAERGVMLQLEMSPGLAACAADRTMLTEVLTNLLTNAMLYTPAGGTVTVRTGRPLADGAWPIAPDNLPAASVHQPSRWVTVAVIDTGPGMSPEEQAHIFERFYRGEAARNLNLPGTGLGLSICHDVMQRHGGHITVASAIGQGSTFTLWLPAA